jgi:potassium-transporting ATPase potassium-binding subunit
MTLSGIAQISAYLVLLIVLARPLGVWMSRVFNGERTFLDPVLKPLERLIYRLAGIQPEQEMGWKMYAASLLLLNFFGLVVLYSILRLQHLLPFNPQGFAPVPADLAFNTAASFTSNTNWQSYGGETTMSYLSQMAGLTVQNFLSAATGIAVLVALTRGLARQSARTLGNFWVDLTRSTLYILIPLSFGMALLLVSQGVVQTLQANQTVSLLQPYQGPDEELVTTQVLATGPAASQIAIKQLGTNGGGFFNVNSAHPFENPTPFSGLVESLAILLIPAALTFTYGKMVGAPRQGNVILAVMVVVFCSFLLVTLFVEQQGNPLLESLGVDQQASTLQPGGNMEGKETRFGITDSALWAVATTAASNGSVNSMHDSFSPLGGMSAMVLMLLGEVIFGGVGSGLYGMLAFVVVAVFVAGLMVGRTPEYLGKKIEAFEMKMASLMIIIPILIVLLGVALVVSLPDTLASTTNPGPHGFSQILYAFASAGNNNGSAFAGFGANTPVLNMTLGLAMLLSRYWLIIPALALAGSLCVKVKVPESAGTLPTDSVLFAGWLTGVVLVVGALSFFPVLALGPIVEQFLLGF